MSTIFDAGAFVALERGERETWRRLKASHLAASPPLTHGGVVGQVWRGGSGRQALLAKAMQLVDVIALDERLGRAAGSLLARAGLADVVDAAVVAMAGDGDRIVTSDPDDIALLAAVSGRRIDIVPI